MKFIGIFCASLIFLGASYADAGCGLFRRGGCSDPCSAAACGGNSHGQSGCSSCGLGSSSPNGAYGVSSIVSGSASNGCAACAASGVAGYAQAAISTGPVAVQTQQQDLMDCGPVTTYRVVMEPKYITESRPVQATEYRDEIRTRTRVISRQVPVEVQDYRSTTVMVPTTETKTVEYTVLVPQQNEKTVEIVESVPVWNEVSEEYTVRVPNVVDVPEEYTVRVPQLRTEDFTYTAYVPQTQTQTKIHTFTNAVPVTKTRTVQVCRPVTRTQTVTKDYGRWEVRVEEVAASGAGMSYTSPSLGCAPSAGYSGVTMGGCGTSASYGCGSSVGACASCGGCGQVYATQARGCRIARRCGSCGGCGLRSRACASSTGCSGGCGAAGGCNSGCGNGVYGSSTNYAASGCGSGNVGCATVNYAPQTQTVSRRVWVPNVTTEEVPVVENVTETQEVSYTAFEQKTEQIPYECTYLVYAPEQRTGTRQVVDYVNETRSRTRKVVQYSDETRTRTHKQLSYNQQTRTETIPYVSYSTEKRTKEVSFTINVPQTKVEPFTTTRFDTVQEEIPEQYTVKVPVCVTKETQVQVCRMVPKLVPVTIYPCSSAVNSTVSGAGYYGNAGCANCGTPTLAPQQLNSGCTNCGKFGCTICPQ